MSSDSGAINLEIAVTDYMYRMLHHYADRQHIREQFRNILVGFIEGRIDVLETVTYLCLLFRDCPQFGMEFCGYMLSNCELKMIGKRIMLRNRNNGQVVEIINENGEPVDDLVTSRAAAA